ncbi:MAG: helix-turn-helix domain-containing protein [Erysipelotrichaceae bacterium]|nr:helix-turn-helix domain-containing protein [Erysipelotrichaceae bacterium]
MINNLYSYRLSKDELVILAVILIILSDNYVTINDVADNLLVSRTTFINSLPDMKSYFKHLDLEFKSSSKKGMKIVNSELERRIALLKLIDETVMENRFLMNIVLKNELFFDEDFRDIIKPILSDAFSHFDKKVTSKSFSVLEYYLCISVQRMLNGHYLDKIDSHVSDNTDFSLYIFQKLKEEYEFEINEDEIHFVDAICDSTIGKTKDSSPIQQSLSIQLLAAKLIEDVSGDMGIDFADDMDLQKCLTNHLTSIYLQKNMKSIIMMY